MTIRRSKRAPTSPEEIAAAVPAAAIAVFNQTTDYRTFSKALTEEVEEITGRYDHRLTMRVAEVLRVSAVDWFKRQLIQQLPG